MSSSTPIETFVGHWINIIKSHEKLLIIIITSVFMMIGANHLFGYLEKRDQKVYDHDKAVLQADKDKSDAQAQANAQLAQQYQALVAKVTADNTRLEATVAQRDAAVKQQQIVDQTLAPADLAVRWESVANLKPGSVQPAAGGYAVQDDAARETVSRLEWTDALDQDVKDLKTEVAGKDQLLAQRDQQVTGLNGEVTDLRQQQVDADKACQAQVKLVKAQARRGKLRWFAAGYVLGLVTRPLIRGFGL